MIKEFPTKIKQKISIQVVEAASDDPGGIQSMQNMPKAKAYLILHLVRDVKGNKKGFFRCISSKNRTRENPGLLLNGAGDWLMKDIKKAKAFDASFPQSSTSETSLQETKVSETSMKVQSKKDLLSMEENQHREHLNRLDMHKSMGPDGMYQDC